MATSSRSCSKFIGLFLLLLLFSCDIETPTPIQRTTDVIVEGRITTDGGAKPMANMWVKLIRDRPMSFDINELTTKTDASGYYRFKFKANHELNQRTYALSYDISTVEKDPYFCSAEYFRIGYLLSADTTLIYNFQIPRKTHIQCVYSDPVRAKELELNTTFRFTCGPDLNTNKFNNSTGAASVDYTESPLFIPANVPVIAVTSGIDRSTNKAVQQMDTIMVPFGAPYTHRIDVK